MTNNCRLPIYRMRGRDSAGCKNLLLFEAFVDPRGAQYSTANDQPLNSRNGNGSWRITAIRISRLGKCKTTGNQKQNEDRIDPFHFRMIFKWYVLSALEIVNMYIPAWTKVRSTVFFPFNNNSGFES